MGCGSSAHVVAPAPENGHKMTNGQNGHNDRAPHDDGLPTVVLPDTPVKSKPPIAFEIPLEEFNSSHRPTSPPAHLQRLLHQQSAEISLPDIEGKLAEAEQRRQAILQQRAASAQKKSQKIAKNLQDTMILNKIHDFEEAKHNTLIVPSDPGLEDKNI
ncbi:uncharacterized protein LOC119833875 isoform X2 [Zerene cesonia]|uniref:uncharacterized protein LOC119833875 isoform X2 n=1 Tax=Zerene cesonia TaxID=33412 RepID=UPI0018E4EF9A|nr:uncharacterized protein LOC119833875 isoform X2 [Zerene cesonia]